MRRERCPAGPRNSGPPGHVGVLMRLSKAIDPQSPWVLPLAVPVLAYVACVGVTVVHELLGHATMALLLGGHIRSVAFGPFAMSGEVDVAFEGQRPTAHAVVSLAGLVANLVTGGAAWIVSRRPCTLRPWTTFVLLLFAGISLFGAASYTTLGLYYGSADPVSIPALLLRRSDFWRFWETPWTWRVFWVPPFCAVVFIGYAFVRSLAAFFDQHMGGEPRRRVAFIMRCLAGVGALGVAVTAMKSERIFDGPERRLKAAAASRRIGELRAADPDLSSEQVFADLKRNPPVVTTELPFRLRGLHLLMLAACGGLVAMGSLNQPNSRRDGSPR